MNRMNFQEKNQLPIPNLTANVDVSLNDYITPDAVMVSEMRCITSGDIKIDSDYSTGVLQYSADYDIFKIDVRKIYNVGTSAGLQSRCITLTGWYFN